MNRPKRSFIWEIGNDIFETLVQDSSNWNELLKGCGYTHSGNNLTLKRRIKRDGLDTSHFKKSAPKNIPNSNVYKYELSEVLVYNIDYKPENQTLKRRLVKFNLLKDECLICKIKPLWNNKKLILQLDHINGNKYDNRIENLRILCPNCHSQTDTFCSKSKSTGINCTNINKLYFNKVIKELNYRFKYKNKKCLKCKKIILNKCTHCQKCYSLNSRKVERPSKDQLIHEVKTTTYVATGKKYGVSDNTIRKWLKQYSKEE